MHLTKMFNLGPQSPLVLSISYLFLLKKILQTQKSWNFGISSIEQQKWCIIWFSNFLLKPWLCANGLDEIYWWIYKKRIQQLKVCSALKGQGSIFVPPAAHQIEQIDSQIFKFINMNSGLTIESYIIYGIFFIKVW